MPVSWAHVLDLPLTNIPVVFTCTPPLCQHTHTHTHKRTHQPLLSPPAMCLHTTDHTHTQAQLANKEAEYTHLAQEVHQYSAHHSIQDLETLRTQVREGQHTAGPWEREGKGPVEREGEGEGQWVRALGQALKGLVDERVDCSGDRPRGVRVGGVWWCVSQ